MTSQSREVFLSWQLIEADGGRINRFDGEEGFRLCGENL
jgi:hypothetical protein